MASDSLGREFLVGDPVCVFGVIREIGNGGVLTVETIGGGANAAPCYAFVIRPRGVMRDRPGDRPQEFFLNRRNGKLGGVSRVAAHRSLDAKVLAEQPSVRA